MSAEVAPAGPGGVTLSLWGSIVAARRPFSDVLKLKEDFPLMPLPVHRIFEL